MRIFLFLALAMVAGEVLAQGTPGVTQIQTIVNWVTALMTGIGTLALMFAGIGFFSGRFQWGWLASIGVGLLVAAIAAQIVGLFL